VAAAICPTVAPYSRDFQAQAAAALDTLPDGHPLVVMLQDYAQLRDEARACRGQEIP